MTDIFKNLLTVDEWTKKYKWPTKGGLRWLIYRENAERTGFESCIVRVHRRVFIDELKFEEWMRSGASVYDDESNSHMRYKKNGAKTGCEAENDEHDDEHDTDGVNQRVETTTENE